MGADFKMVNVVAYSPPAALVAWLLDSIIYPLLPHSDYAVLQTCSMQHSLVLALALPPLPMVRCLAVHISCPPVLLFRSSFVLLIYFACDKLM